MKIMATLRCRPSEAEKEPILVFMSAAQMLSLKLKNGSICRIAGGQYDVPAVSWLTTKSDLKEGVAGVSKWLQERCGIKLGNEITVTKIADEVTEEACTLSIRPLDVFDLTKKLKWELNAVDVLAENFRYVVPGQKIAVGTSRQRHEFEILGLSDDIYKAASITRVKITDTTTGSRKITFQDIGGLEEQKQRLRRLIERATRLSDSTRITLFPNAIGILLYGPAGTGKSMLRKALESEHAWADIVTWEGSGSKHVPSSASQLVHIDVRSKLSALDATALVKIFNLSPPSTIIVAEVRDPNNLQDFLRTGSTFAYQIEVSIPAAEQRYSILSLLNSGLLPEDLLKVAANKTHGYVGDDLRQLLREILDFAEIEQSLDSTDMPQVTVEHVSKALTHVRPSALQQVILEKPNVRWSDIGGQEAFKERLRNAVEWPLKYPTQLKSYNIPPKKGVLLYGPPGCSKTMLVKALATESDYNFLAVKGAELISMYVGESERATRDVFRKARAASPCIIFFDEIDAIAKRTSDSSMLNVLTTLLNEMDGFEELKDVFVVAATNKPQTIDPALMRPGRFDNVVYIGPPDVGTRKAIFAEQIRRIQKLDIDLPKSIDILVQNTDGFSGAEVVAACQLAGELAFSASTRQADGLLLDVTVADMLEAIKRTPRSITTQMLQEYETWNAERNAS